MFFTARRAWVATAISTVALGAAAAIPSPAAAAGKPRTAKVTAKHKAAIRQFRRALQANTPTGPVAHFKGTNSPGAGQPPASIEGWVEFGGADRYRYVQTPSGGKGERQIVWGRGGYWAVTDVMRTDRGLREVTNVGYTDAAVAYDSFVLGLRYADDAQGLFDTAPAGPAVDGTATRAVPVALPFASASVSQQMTYLLDASTHEPLRLTSRILGPDGSVFDESATDFALWENLPAGAGAGVLGGEVPLTATIQSTEG